MTIETIVLVKTNLDNFRDNEDNYIQQYKQ